MTDAPDDAHTPLRDRKLALLVLLVAVVLVCFLPGITGEFVWDDIALIKSNLYVRDLSRLGEALTHDFWYVPGHLEHDAGFGRRYYRPVITLAYAMQFRLFGESPTGYHAVSLGLHVACALLAFQWLWRRLGGSTRTLLPAVLGAALFAIHPTRPESVTWISGSTDLWMTLFLLLGLRAFAAEDPARSAWRPALYFFLAVLCKETAVTGVALLAIDLWLIPTPGDAHARWKRWGLLLGVTLLALAIRAAVLPSFLPANTLDTAARTPVRVLSSLGHYARALAWPWPASAQSPLQLLDARGHPLYAPWSVALGAALTGALAALGLRARRTPSARPWLADALWFFVALAPTSNLIPMSMTVLTAWRFLYLPMLGVAALLARALAAGEARGPIPTAYGAVVAALLGFGVITSAHAAHFNSTEDLWTHELRVNPCNHHALGEIAALQLSGGQWTVVPATLQRAYECARRNGAGDSAVSFAVRAAQFVVWTSPDDDRAALRSARDFFDDFTTRRSGTATLRTARIRLETELLPREFELRQRLRLDGDRAYAWFRLGDFAAAEGQLRALIARDAHANTGRRYLAMTLAAQERFDEARATLLDLSRRTASPEPLALAQRFDAIRAALQGARNPTDRSVARARLFVALGLSQRARELLPEALRATTEESDVYAALIEAELEDRRRPAARALISTARARFPAQAPRWDAMELSARALPTN